VNYAVTGSGASPANALDFEGSVLPSGTLSFAPGVTSQLITVNVLGDTTVESNEGFTVSLSSPSSGSVISNASATGTILNDDSPPAPPTLGISATSANKSEGTGGGSTPFVFTITRSGSLAAASSVRYSVQAGTGSNRANSKDFTNGFVKNVLVNFPAGIPTVDVTVNVRADSKAEPDETFQVALSNAVGATISAVSASGTIQNDDGTGAARDDEEGQTELIAVADPLWMFVPPEFLTAEQLAVPTMTWINGIAHVGDLAHDHDHGDDHDDAIEFDEAEEFALATPMDFEAGGQRLSSLLTRFVSSNSAELSETLGDSPLVQSSKDSDQALLGFDAIEVQVIDISSDSNQDHSFESIDVAFGDTSDEWLLLSGKQI
jgi:hypothetical protein